MGILKDGSNIASLLRMKAVNKVMVCFESRWSVLTSVTDHSLKTDHRPACSRSRGTRRRRRGIPRPPESRRAPWAHGPAGS